jgi:hypothetical protein
MLMSNSIWINLIVQNYTEMYVARELLDLEWYISNG